MAGRPDTTVTEDRMHQEGVLMFLLEERLVTVQEIVTYRQAFARPDKRKDFRDGTERAVYDLAGMGVVHIEGPAVWASVAAREAVRISEGVKPELRS